MGSRWRLVVLVAILALLAVPLALGGGVAAVSDSPTAAPVDTAATPADPPPERWNRTYGPTAGTVNQVEITRNGTVFAVGSRLAPDGSELDAWVVTGTTNGTEHWNRTYGGNEDDVFTDVAPTADGGALLVGTSVSQGPGGEDGWALKVDSQGSVEWRIATGGPGDDRFADVQRTDDGYLIVGTYTAGNDTDGWLVKVRTNGKLAWTQRYDVGVSDSLAAIEPRQGGGYVLAGQMATITDPRPDGLVLFVGSDGDRERQRFFGGRAGDRFLAAQGTPDGGLILAGATRSAGSDGERGWVLRMDADGTRRWGRAYETGPLTDVEPTADGGYVLAGTTPPSDELSDAMALTVWGDGATAWKRSYGGTSYESFASVAVAPDGGYVFAGASGTDRGWPGTGWLLKLGGRASSALPQPPLLTPDTPTTPGEGTPTTPTVTPGTGPAGATPAGDDDGMSLLSILIVVVVVSIFLAGFAFLLWDLADDPLAKLNERTPLVDLTVVFNHFNIGDGSGAGPDPAGTGRDFDGFGEGGNADGFGGDPSGPDAGGGAGGFGGAGGAGGTDAGGGTGGFGGAGGPAADPTDEPIDVGGGTATAGSTAAGGTAQSGDVADAASTAAAGAGPVADESTAGDADWDLADEAAADSTDLVVAEEANGESEVPTTRAPVPGTFTLRNADDRELICRFRCHTIDEVVFDYWVDIAPGATRQAHATPTDDPFTILINVEDEHVASQVFVNNDRGGTSVTATVSEDAIDISPTDELDDPPITTASDTDAADDDVQASAGEETTDDDAATDLLGDDADPVRDDFDDAAADDATVADTGAVEADEVDGDGWSPDDAIAGPDDIDDDLLAEADTDDLDDLDDEPADVDEALDDADAVASFDETQLGDADTDLADVDDALVEGDDDWTPDIDIAEPDEIDDSETAAFEADDVADGAEETAESTDAAVDDADTSQTDAADDWWPDEGSDGDDGADSTADATETGAEESGMDSTSDPWADGIQSSQAGDIDVSSVADDQNAGPPVEEDTAWDEADEDRESEPADESSPADDDAPGIDQDEDPVDDGADDSDPADVAKSWTDSLDDDPAEDAPWVDDVDIDRPESDDRTFAWADELDAAQPTESDETSDATSDDVDDVDPEDVASSWTEDIDGPQFDGIDTSWSDESESPAADGMDESDGGDSEDIDTSWTEDIDSSRMDELDGPWSDGDDEETTAADDAWTDDEQGPTDADDWADDHEATESTADDGDMDDLDDMWTEDADGEETDGFSDAWMGGDDGDDVDDSDDETDQN